MSLLVRTWNVFHGRTVPETGRLHLEAMIHLVSQGSPDVVGLQEVPVWALGYLELWSGMRAVGAVTMHALAGPLARGLTDLDPRRLRSSLTGQANALLLGRRVRVVESAAVRLNPPSLRRQVPLPRRVRLEWAWNRRFAQVVRLDIGGLALLVVNLHATKLPELAALELDRFGASLPAGRALALGDFNVAASGLAGFSRPLPGIDQILGRDVEFEARPTRWSADRRRFGDGLLSDHAPVEALARVGSPVA